MIQLILYQSRIYLKVPHPCSLEMAVGKQLFHLQFSSVTQSCLTLCNPLHCSTPGLPVHCQLKLMSIESVMPSNHLILCHPFYLRPPSAVGNVGRWPCSFSLIPPPIPEPLWNLEDRIYFQFTSPALAVPRMRSPGLNLLLIESFLQSICFNLSTPPQSSLRGRPQWGQTSSRRHLIALSSNTAFLTSSCPLTKFTSPSLSPLLTTQLF